MQCSLHMFQWSFQGSSQTLLLVWGWLDRLSLVDADPDPTPRMLLSCWPMAELTSKWTISTMRLVVHALYFYEAENRAHYSLNSWFWLALDELVKESASSADHDWSWSLHRPKPTPKYGLYSGWLYPRRKLHWSGFDSRSTFRTSKSILLSLSMWNSGF